jgi:hypothetical protein
MDDENVNPTDAQENTLNVDAEAPAEGADAPAEGGDAPAEPATDE